MGLKFLLNIIYNVGIFVLIVCLVWAFKHQEYPVMAGVIFLLALLVLLKIRLIKQVKELTRNRKS